MSELWGISFGVNQRAIMKLSGRGIAAKWRNFLAESYVNSELGGSGFELSGANLFLPIRVDAKELSEAYPNSLDDALTPLDESFEKQSRSS